MAGGSSKYRRIADLLRQEIRSGSYGPGDRLPGENDLMGTHHVARATARRALALLAAEGLAVARQGKGVYVTGGRVPFERLMEYAAGLSAEDLQRPLGALAARVGEQPGRLLDAIDAVRVMAAGRTCLSPVDIRAAEDPVVARAVIADRGTIVTGFSA